jgi:hypothetical protein
MEIYKLNVIMKLVKIHNCLIQDNDIRLDFLKLNSFPLEIWSITKRIVNIRLEENETDFHIWK